MKKSIRKPIAIFIALLMTLSSVSSLVYALDDAPDGEYTLNTVWSVLGDDGYAQGNYAKRGDTVKADVYATSDFVAEDFAFMFAYNSDLLTVDWSNNTEGGVYGHYLICGDGISGECGDGLEACVNMWNDGYLTAETLSSLGGSMVTDESGNLALNGIGTFYIRSTSVESRQFDNTYLFTMYFTVNSTASLTEKSKFTVIPDTMANNDNFDLPGNILMIGAGEDGEDLTSEFFNLTLNSTSEELTIAGTVNYETGTLGRLSTSSTVAETIDDDGNASYVETGYYGEAIASSVPTLTDEDHAFIGWSTVAGSADDILTADELAAVKYASGDDVETLYAIYDYKDTTYTVNIYEASVALDEEEGWFVSQYPTEPTTVIADVSGKVAQELDLTDTAFLASIGYTLDAPGCYIDTETDETAETSDTTVTLVLDSTSNIYSLYIARNQYTLEISPNGGYFGIEKYNTSLTYPLYYGTEWPAGFITESSMGVARVGYTFNSWSTTPAVGNVEDGFTMPAADVTVLAQWTANDYTINWTVIDPVDSSVRTVVRTDTVTIESDASAAPAAADYAVDGYTFAWDEDSVQLTSSIIKSIGSDSTYTVFGRYTALPFDVTYKYNDGGLTADKTITYACHGTVIPGVPTYEGHTFKGWAWTKTEDNTAVEEPTYMPAYDLTANATWEVEDYNLQFNVNGGTAMDDMTVTYGTETTVPAAVKSGYTFVGWYLDEGLTQPVVIADADGNYTGVYTPTDLGDNDADGNPANVPVYAKYQINQYTITFDTDGGTEIASITQDYNTAVPSISDPTKTGNTFAGWDQTIPSFMPDHDVTITALWNPEEYVLHFNTNGGSAVEDLTVTYGTEATVPATEKTGYTFTGWYFDEDLTNPVVVAAAGGTYTGAYTPADLGNNDADGNPAVIQVYAQFSKNTYTISYDTDGGSAVAGASYLYGATVDTTVSTSKTGYTFAGWSYEPALDGNETDGYTMPAYNVTATALWNINEYTITYKFENGNEDKTSTFSYNQEVTIEGDPVKTGYTFSGWSWKDSEAYGGGDTTAPVRMPAKDLVATATWNIEQYVLQFNEDGGNAVDDMTVTYGVEATVPATTKTGYTFLGWYFDESLTQPAVIAAADGTYTGTYTPADLGNNDADGNSATVQLYAKYQINQYTITFDTDGGTEIAAITQDYNSDVTAPAAPVKTGYTFSGWDIAVPAKMPADNITITAQWTVENYVLHFNTDGSAVADTTVTYNTAATIPATSKTGYTFNGWYFDEALTQPIAVAAADGTYTGAYTPADLGDNDADGNPATVQAYAKFTANEYNATFKLNYTGAPSDTVVPVTFDTEILYDVIPYRTGYSFMGWAATEADAAAGTAVASLGNMDDVNGKTFWAIWSADQVDVIFNPNGGTIEGSTESVTVDTYHYDDAITSYANALKTGYEFKGWARSADAKTAEALGKVDSTSPITFYAVYEVKSYDITYKYNDGGLTADKTVTVTYGEAVVIDSAPSYAGHTFTGWTVDPALDGDETEGYTMPACDVEISANWSVEQYTLKFSTDGGTAVADETVTYGTESTLPATSKTGYTFDGWYFDEAFTQPVAVADADGNYTGAYTPADLGADGAEVPVYAKFTAIDYTVTYVLDNGEADIVKTFTVEELIKSDVPTNPEREGFNFTGWVYTYEAQVYDEDTKAYETRTLVLDVTDSTYMIPSSVTATAGWASADVIKLMPVEGSTTMIERNNVVETYNNIGSYSKLPYGVNKTLSGTAYCDQYDKTGSNLYSSKGANDNWYVYGLQTGLTVANIGKYVTVSGEGGRIEVVGAYRDRIVSTGTIIKVWDTNGTPDDESDDILVEQFRVVIYGDIDCNGAVNNNDVTLAAKEPTSRTFSKSSSKIPYICRAADMDQNSAINNTDATRLSAVVGKTRTLSQITGVTTAV